MAPSRTPSPDRDYCGVSDDDSNYDDSLRGNHFKDPNYFTRLKNQFLEMKSAGQFSDVTLIVSGRKFTCHKNILSAVSEYFRAMFTSGMREQHSKEVPIAGVEADVFDQVIEYIYTGELHMDDESVRSLCEAADMFNIEPLKQGCGRYLSKNLNSDNCLAVWKLSEIHHMSPVAIDAYRFALEHVYDVTESHDFLSLSEEDLCRYLGDVKLWINEEEHVWEKAFKWLQHNPDLRLLSLMPILAQIRLLDMDPVYLRNELRRLSSVFDQCPDAEQYVKDVLDHLVYGMPQPTTQAPLSLRMNTCYTRELVVLGGQTHNEGRVTKGHFYSCQPETILKQGTVPLEYEHSWRHDREPSYYNLNMACCEMGGDIYISGYGKGVYKNEVWRYVVKTLSWQYYGKMVYSRQYHCMVTGNKRHLYILGGYPHNGNKRPQASVEKHLVETGNDLIGDLAEPVYMSDVVFYKDCIYIFGGKTHKHVSTDVIQAFDVHRCHGYKLQVSLPEPQFGIRSVLYGDWLILLGEQMTLVTTMKQLSDNTGNVDNKEKAKEKTKGCHGNKDAVNETGECSHGNKDSANQKEDSSHGSNEKGECSHSNKDTANQNSDKESLLVTFVRQIATDSTANQKTDKKCVKSADQGKCVVWKPQQSKGRSSNKRVVKIKTSKSKVDLPTTAPQNTVFTIKSGVGKQSFGAELLGNCIYIVGGREPADRGLFDYSSCICACPVLDVINPDKKDLEWTPKGKLDHFMTVCMTTSVRIFRHKNSSGFSPGWGTRSRSRSRSWSRSRSLRSRSRSFRSRSLSFRSRSRSLRSRTPSYRSSRSRSRNSRISSVSRSRSPVSYRYSRSRSRSFTDYSDY